MDPIKKILLAYLMSIFGAFLIVALGFMDIISATTTLLLIMLLFGGYVGGLIWFAMEAM